MPALVGSGLGLSVLLKSVLQVKPILDNQWTCNATISMSLPDDASAIGTVLATKHGRAVLENIHSREDEIVSLDELAAALRADEATDGRQQLTLRLHHATLPKLDDAGAIQYDAVDCRIESHDTELASRVVDLLQGST